MNTNTKIVAKIAKSQLIIYVVIIVYSLFPLKIFNIDWQRQFIATIVNNAAIPLAGVAFLFVIDLCSSRIRKLARLAAIGFLLVIALQIYVSLSSFQLLDSSQLNQSRLLEQQQNVAKTTISRATKPEQMIMLTRSLVPSEQIPDFNKKPITEQQRDLLKRVDILARSGSSSLMQERSRIQTALILECLRNILLALIFSFAFFSLRDKRKDPPIALHDFNVESNDDLD